MLCLHLWTPGIFPQWLTLFSNAPQFFLSNHVVSCLKTRWFWSYFPVLFAPSWRPWLWTGCSGGSLESKQERLTWRSRKQQRAGHEKPLTCWNSVGTGVDNCLIGSCRGETGIFAWNKDAGERSVFVHTTNGFEQEQAFNTIFRFLWKPVFQCFRSVITGCVFRFDCYITHDMCVDISEPKLTYCMFKGMSHFFPLHPLAVAWAGLADNPK